MMCEVFMLSPTDLVGDDEVPPERRQGSR
jgi:hypothetical protein